MGGIIIIVQDNNFLFKNLIVIDLSDDLKRYGERTV